MTNRQRKIIHIDMDCFYAAVEMRDNPALREVPIAVGGAADRRGVVSTCNYQAREFGIHSAMATAYALRLCPSLVVLPGRMSYYVDVSRQIRAIFKRYTQLIEPLSLDEAFLDVSDVSLFGGSATLIALDIRDAIRRELNLTASAGVAPNKFIAKVCSDENKPDGQCVVAPEGVADFVANLPLKKIPGVGRVTLKRLADQGLFTCADVRALELPKLVRRFGGLGELLHKRARGIDQRELTISWVRKSVSVERTFVTDLPEPDAAVAALDDLFAELGRRLERHQHRTIRSQHLKLKFADFEITTIERQTNRIDRLLFATLLPLAWDRQPGKGIRLLGIGVTFRESESGSTQLTLF